MTGDWTHRRMPFKFRVSELTLLTVHRNLAVRTFGLDGEPLSTTPGAILDEMPSEVQGLLLKSYPTERELPAVELDGDVIRYVPQQYPRYFIDLTMSSEDYEQKFSSKSRSTLRRKVRKLAKASGGEVDWREYRRPEEMEEFHRLARQVSEHTYQEKLLDAGLPDGDDYRAELEALAAEDNLRGYLVFLDGEPIAYLCSPIQNGIVKYGYLGYLPDREISDLSPGTVLLWLAVRKLQDEGGYRMFDFTEGGDRRRKDQKAFFATGHRRCAEVYYLRPTFLNRAIVRAHAGLDRGSERLGDLLERYHLRRRVRSMLRRLSGVPS